MGLRLADFLRHPIPPGRRRPSCCWTPRPRCRAWRLKFEGSVRRCAPMSPTTVIAVPLLLHPSVPWLADPSSTLSGPGSGTVRTSQTRRALPRGGRGTARTGRPPATTAGGAAALSREAAGSGGLQGPAGGEGGRSCGRSTVGRGLEAGRVGGGWSREVSGSNFVGKTVIAGKRSLGRWEGEERRLWKGRF